MEPRKCNNCKLIVSISECDFDCEISGEKVEVNATCPNCDEPLWFTSKPLSDFTEEG